MAVTNFTALADGKLAWDERGRGDVVVLLHAGIADRRMWDHQVDDLSDAFHLVRLDLRGYGESTTPTAPFTHARDVEAFLDAQGFDRVAIVGCSLGGAVALEVAAGRRDRVSRLGLLSSGLPGFEWSSDIRQVWADMADAFAEGEHAGDLDWLNELEIRLWIDGPNRGPADVDAAVRRKALALNAAVQVRESEEGYVEPTPPDGPLLMSRLELLDMPALVVTGDQEVEDMRVIADLLAARLPNARRAVVAGAGHLVALERPDEVGRLLRAFLSADTQ